VDLADTFTVIGAKIAFALFDDFLTIYDIPTISVIQEAFISVPFEI
jgi:hypothetical protein